MEVTERDIKVWSAMADHYLDTETRPELPHTALVCIEAGLSVEEARAIWRDEVEPTLGPNLLSVAGEWGAWDQAWLIERLMARRARNARLGFIGKLLRWPELNLTAWVSIERCMHALLAAQPEVRAALARELSQKSEKS